MGKPEVAFGPAVSPRKNCSKTLKCVREVLAGDARG